MERETLELFELMSRNSGARGRDHQFGIGAPTMHCRAEEATEKTVVGEREMGDARLDHYGLYLRWLITDPGALTKNVDAIRKQMSRFMTWFLGGCQVRRRSLRSPRATVTGQLL